MPSSTTTTARSPSPAFSDSESGPSRKRARTDISNDERKEARAHRNRIAAQNSRDRRKAQFSYLERRVAELEEENRQLRVGMGISPTIAALSSAVTLQSTAAKLAEEEKQRAREKENEELKERIKTLEKGWEAVMKALTVQGFSPQTLQQQSSPSSVTPTPSVTTTSMPPVSTAADSSTPVKVEELMTSSTTSFPISPAPSHTSLDFDIDIDTASSPSSIFSGTPDLSSTSPVLEFNDSTCHLARMVTTSVALQRVVSPHSRTLLLVQPTTIKAPLMMRRWSRSSVKSSRLHRHLKRPTCLLSTRRPPLRRQGHPPRRK